MVASIVPFFVYLLCSYVYSHGKDIFKPYEILLKTTPKFGKDSSVSLNQQDFETSYTGIEFSPIPGTYSTISSLDLFVFDNNTNHDTKGALYITSYQPQLQSTTYILYPNPCYDYGYSIYNVALSTLLKKDFNINTNLLVKFIIKQTNLQDIPEVSIQQKYLTKTFFIFIFLLISAFINLSGYMVNVPLKERLVTYS
jgi:hypothetical protein